MISELVGREGKLLSLHDVHYTTSSDTFRCTSALIESILLPS